MLPCFAVTSRASTGTRKLQMRRSALDAEAQKLKVADHPHYINYYIVWLAWLIL
jgi:hypothetical protein